MLTNLVEISSLTTRILSSLCAPTAAARALMNVEDMSAEDVAQRAMDIASDMCVYTNKNFVTYTLEDVGDILAAENPEADK